MPLLSIGSFILAIILLFVILAASPIPEFIETIFEYCWILLLAVPIQAVVIVVSILYKNKGYKNNVFVLGICFSILLLVFGISGLYNSMYISHDKEYINELENTLHNIDIPSDCDVSVLYYTDDTIDYALVRFTDTDAYYMENQLKGKNYSIDDDLYYENYYLLENCDYFLIYDMTCGKYNNYNGTCIYHKHLLLGYDVDTGLLVVIYLYGSSLDIY